MLERAAAVFGGESGGKANQPDIKELHAKIGQQALEIDFLAGTLGRIGDPSAKRCSLGYRAGRSITNRDRFLIAI